MKLKSRNILNRIYNLNLSKKIFYVFILSAVLSIIIVDKVNVPIVGYKKFFILWLSTFVSFSIVIIVFHTFSKISKKLIRLSSISEIDFKMNKSYYRDLIEHYDLAELSYIDDLEVDEKDIVVLLLNMELNGIIKLDNGNIKVLDTSKISRKSEEYIINCIENNKLNKVDITKFKDSILADCLNEGLINKITLFNLIFILVLLYPIILIISAFFGISKLFFLVAFFMGFILNPYKRSKEGKEINRKLEGLKLFLKDFTTLDNRDHKELLLWEDYLIYSVLFNQNKKIKEEVINTYLK